MENIGARRGNIDIDEVRATSRWLGVVCHLLQIGTDLGRGEVQATALVDVGHFRLSSTGLDVRGDAGLAIVFRYNLDGLNSISMVNEYARCLVVSGFHLRERLRGVLGEHGDHHPVHNLELRSVKGCDLNENIGGVHANLGVVTVDDRGQGADRPVRVVNHGVDRRVANDMQILAQLLVFLSRIVRIRISLIPKTLTYLVEGHQLLAVHLLGLLQRDKLDVLGRQSLIREGTFNGVQVMGANGYKGPLTRQVLVKLILEGDEGVVAGRVELDIAQNSTRDVWSDLGGLNNSL